MKANTQENIIMALVRMLRGGQITLPAEARKALKLSEGDYLDLEVKGSTPTCCTDRADWRRELGGGAAHHPGRATLLLRSGDHHGPDPAGGVPRGAAPDRRADRLHPPAARSRSRRAGPLHPEPPG